MKNNRINILFLPNKTIISKTKKIIQNNRFSEINIKNII